MAVSIISLQREEDRESVRERKYMKIQTCVPQSYKQCHGEDVASLICCMRRSQNLRYVIGNGSRSCENSELQLLILAWPSNGHACPRDLLVAICTTPVSRPPYIHLNYFGKLLRRTHEHVHNFNMKNSCVPKRSENLKYKSIPNEIRRCAEVLDPSTIRLPSVYHLSNKKY